MDTLLVISEPQASALEVMRREKLSYHLTNSRSQNTRLAYTRQWGKFVEWAEDQQLPYFPASIATICLYLAHLNDEQKKFSSIEQALAAIRAVHGDNGQPLPADTRLVSVLKSIKRDMACSGRSTVKKPHAFTQAEIEMMVAGLDPSTPQGVQAKAVILLGVNAGLRASEIGALLLSDITFDEMGMELLIRTSKTDQYGAGDRIFIGRLAPHQRKLDPVKAMEDWLAFRKETTTHVFLNYRKGGHTPYVDTKGVPVRLSTAGVTGILTRASRRLPEARRTSSHALRHSFITNAFRKNLPANQIAKTSRHRNLSSLTSYDQTTRREQVISPRLWD